MAAAAGSARADPGRTAPLLRAEDAANVARVLAHLNVLAPLWRALRVDQALVFEWPEQLPKQHAGGSGS